MIPGRLAPVAALVEAAQSGAPELGELLSRSFPALDTPDWATAIAFHGHTAPEGLGAGAAIMWQETALFAVSAQRPPTVSIDGGEDLAMESVPGTSYWIRLEPLATGHIHLHRFGIDGVYGPGSDLAGYNATSYELPAAARGTLSERRLVSSEIYPGATTEYWLYVSDESTKSGELR
jgi:hypothetical protein